jgi:putative pyruvate formate lyase activating enzyme
VASAFPHFGEEDCLRGWNGSGTIFFGWCNLRCVFCQNFETSQHGEGTEVTPVELARMMLDLEAAGCHNINFVTPEHVVPQILEALVVAVEHGLRLPLVYNTSAYDSLESIQLMDGLVDIYMPDFKLWDTEHCRNYLVASDYADAARVVIAGMHAQVGELKVDEQGLALRGVLVRHLVMPGLLDDTREIMRWIATTLSRDTYVNVMDQYYPAHKAETEPRFAQINRHLRDNEFEQAIEHARTAGLWRLDKRWRNVIPHGRPVWLPWMHGNERNEALATVS